MLPWTIDLIEKYKDNWNWIHLSGNKKLPWSFKLIDRYKDKWDWWWLTYNDNIIWSLELIEYFENMFFKEMIFNNNRDSKSFYSVLWKRKFKEFVNIEIVKKVMEREIK